MMIGAKQCTLPQTKNRDNGSIYALLIDTKPASNGSTIHVVQKTETLYSISKRYGVTTKQIQDWNNMSDNNVKLGQKLVIKK